MTKTTTRRCTRCAQLKATSDFSRDRTVPDGMQRNCKRCAQVLKRQYRESLDGQLAEARYNRSVARIASRAAYYQRYRAKQAGRA